MTIDYLYLLDNKFISLTKLIVFKWIDVKDLLPDILQHLGPKQLGDLKDLLASFGGEKKDKSGDDEEIPTLETNFEEATKKVDWEGFIREVSLHYKYT